MNQSKTNVPSINQKPIHIAPDPFLFGFSNPKTFTLLSIPPTPVILRGAEGEVAESIIQQITLALRERGDRHRRWVRARQKHFLTLLIRPRENLLHRKKVFFRSWIQLPSATNE